MTWRALLAANTCYDCQGGLWVNLNHCGKAFRSWHWYPITVLSISFLLRGSSSFLGALVSAVMANAIHNGLICIQFHQIETRQQLNCTVPSLGAAAQLLLGRTEASYVEREAQQCAAKRTLSRSDFVAIPHTASRRCAEAYYCKTVFTFCSADLAGGCGPVLRARCLIALQGFHCFPRA